MPVVFLSITMQFAASHCDDFNQQENVTLSSFSLLHQVSRNPFLESQFETEMNHHLSRGDRNAREP